MLWKTHTFPQVCYTFSTALLYKNSVAIRELVITCGKLLLWKTYKISEDLCIANCVGSEIYVWGVLPF